MEAYKFLTRISKNGSVKLPPTPELFDRDVEIIILPLKRESSKKQPAKKFVEKWAGTIESDSINNDKYDYLIRKHR